MLTRPVVVLLDIDGTLVDLEACKPAGLAWNGGLYFWERCLAALREAGAKAGLDLQFGIATFKPEVGDSVSAIILEQAPRIGNTKPQPGLKAWLHPDLLFFTNAKCKVPHALDLVKKIYPDIAAADIFILDDSQHDVCDRAEKAGYNAMCVGSDLILLTADSRQTRIANCFAKIFERLHLPLPDFIQFELKQTEITLADVKQQQADRNHAPRNYLAFLANLPADEKIESLDDDELPTSLNKPF